jgi:hypothetical protein
MNGFNQMEVILEQKEREMLDDGSSRQKNRNLQSLGSIVESN